MKIKFQHSVINELKYYVYMYLHPVTNEIFYVGKGKANRAFAHLEDTKDSKKVNYIKNLKVEGLEPKIEILIHGLEDEQTALRVEASVIDLLGINNLTNLQSGYHSKTFGRMSIDQVNAIYQNEPVEFDDPVVLFKINNKFRYSMTDQELYDATRAQWKMKLENAEKAKYACAVFDGTIQEVYSIAGWLKSGATLNNKVIEVLEDRIEFVGNIAEEKVRQKYKYKSVAHLYKRGESNPVKYINC